MRIDRATPQDDAGISQLLSQLHDDRVTTFHGSTIRQENRSFVAREENLIVGFLLASLIDYGFSSYGTIEELVVDAAHRGKSVGAELVENCMRWMHENNIEVVFVSSLGDALGFYTKIGFQPCTGPWLYKVPAT